MITGIYGSFLAFLFMFLSIKVVRCRRQYKIAIGDNGELHLQRAVRVQANFTEYTPIFLILLLISELQGLPAYGLHALGILFFAGRCIHAYGVGTAEIYVHGKLMNSKYRVCGMGCTMTAIGLSAIIILTQFIILLFL